MTSLPHSRSKCGHRTRAAALVPSCPSLFPLIHPPGPNGKLIAELYVLTYLPCQHYIGVRLSACAGGFFRPLAMSLPTSWRVMAYKSRAKQQIRYLWL